MLIFLLAACSGTPDQAIDVPAEQVVEEPSATPAPEPSAEPAEPAAPPPPEASTAGEALGHCAAGERTYFDCSVAGDKQLSLCGTPDLKGSEAFLEYRYGPLGKPEMRFPTESAGSVGQFTFEARQHVRSMGDTLQFTNDGYTYTVMAMSGSSHPGEAEANNFVGVMVEHEDKIVATITCASDELDRLAEIAPE